MSNDKKDEVDPYHTCTLLAKGERNYPSSPDQARLEVFENKYASRDYSITFDCPEFTALCPITGQPDLGKIRIEYMPDQTCIESKSLKFYLFSFRDHGTFHEEIVNRILDDLIKACSPRYATVVGTFNPRGGISICVRASHPDQKS
ncbi:MAG: NADPH-dependent 7-cyano-7-deazaguanine reductase QueF [Kiritimatiellae bacterium]|nr:NADPH-dependent 7-cyano-7-deazaguanine reductase QueF [Kiritimatiellia bacterium]